MGHGNEVLFGRIAVYNGLISMQQLDECLDNQRDRASAMHLGQLMIERGLIDDIQAREILSALRRRLHRGMSKERSAQEKKLAEMLIKQSAVEPEDILRAREAQEEMQERGLFAGLADILVQQSSVTLRTLADFQAKISRKSLRCVSCGRKYRAYGYRKGIDARCRKCGGRLQPRDEAPEPPGAPEPEPGDEDITAEIKSPRPPAVPEPPAEPAEPVESFEDRLPEAVVSRQAGGGDSGLAVGDVIGNCRLEERVGHGGMGQVFRARHLALDRESAIKILKPQLMVDPMHVQRFFSEARAAAKLEHPNIVGVHNVGEENGHYFLEMQFLRGRSVKDVLGKKGSFELKEALQMVRQAAGALDYAHRQGMVHRDVKSANVMVSETGHATIVDFGLTKKMDTDPDLTSAGFVVGTASYMSPEQAEGSGVDGRSDLYSLGIMLFEMLTGRVPFLGESPLRILMRHQSDPVPDPRKFRPDMPEAVVKLIMKLLEKSKEARVPSGERLVMAIDVILSRM